MIYHSCYTSGIKGFLKSVPTLQKRHKAIDEELQKTSTKRTDCKKVTIHFDREEQTGYSLVQMGA